MKSILKLFPFLLMFSLLVFGCNKNDDDTMEEENENCVTDPAVSVEENIIGTWIIDGEPDETVTFNSDGSGESSEEAFEFATSNNGKSYNKFNWAMDSDTVLIITYDYSPDTPVTPYVISEDFSVLSNECDKVKTKSIFFCIESTLRRQM